MAEKKKKKTPTPTKGATKTLASKSLKKKTVTKVPAKGKTVRGPKPAPKPAKKTAVSRKPAAKKVAAKTKFQKVSKTPKAADTLNDIKRALIKRRETIVKEAKEEIAKYISGENRQLVDTALDDGDWAVVDISEDINLRRLAAHRKALHAIDEALTKIEEGSYGICEECGEPIGEKRLSVLPAATLCVVCQGNKERLEAVEREAPPV